MLEHPILMVAQATTGARIAMGKGNSGHNQDPPELPSRAPVLYSAQVCQLHYFDKLIPQSIEPSRAVCSWLV